MADVEQRQDDYDSRIRENTRRINDLHMTVYGDHRRIGHEQRIRANEDAAKRFTHFEAVFVARVDTLIRVGRVLGWLFGIAAAAGAGNILLRVLGI